MTYTTASDILKYFNGLSYTDSEGTDNNLSEADVDQFIAEQTVILNMKIAKKYTLPVTDADDLTYLKIICDKMVVCQIDKTLRAYAMDDESQYVRKRNYCKEAQEMIEGIMDGSVPLNSTQKSFVGLRYNKTTVYDNDCDCRQTEVTCSDD